MTKKSIKTTTLSAQVAVSKSDEGMDYVQVMPDNPRVGLVQPFSGWGRGQRVWDWCSRLAAGVGGSCSATARSTSCERCATRRSPN